MVLVLCNTIFANTRSYCTLQSSVSLSFWRFTLFSCYQSTVLSVGCVTVAHWNFDKRRLYWKRNACIRCVLIQLNEELNAPIVKCQNENGKIAANCSGIFDSAFRSFVVRINFVLKRLWYLSRTLNSARWQSDRRSSITCLVPNWQNWISRFHRASKVHRMSWHRTVHG